MNTKPIRSPSYPSLSLEDAIEAVGKIESQYRGSAVDREDAAKLLGYAGLSGPSNKTLAALASFGLVERAGKGMMRVTSRARSILHPDSEAEKARELREAALEPKLFRDIKDRFEDIKVPPMEGVVTHLNREGFNPTAVTPAAKAFVTTMEFIESLRDGESHGSVIDEDPGSGPPDADGAFGGANVGDLVQWESQGALQFETPRRVRWISSEGDWIAVDGSDTAIPMDEIIVEKSGSKTPPPIPPEHSETEDVQASAGQRKAVFPVSEGDVTFIFPDRMTEEGIEELEAYLAVFLKKEKRQAAANTP